MCDGVCLFLSNVEDFVCLFCFQQLCLTASSVQTKQHSIADEQKKKKMALFIQFHFRREVYYERTVQVELPVMSLL